jgi:hypothetical protein
MKGLVRNNRCVSEVILLVNACLARRPSVDSLAWMRHSQRDEQNLHFSSAAASPVPPRMPRSPAMLAQLAAEPARPSLAAALALPAAVASAREAELAASEAGASAAGEVALAAECTLARAEAEPPAPDTAAAASDFASVEPCSVFSPAAAAEGAEHFALCSGHALRWHSTEKAKKATTNEWMATTLFQHQTWRAVERSAAASAALEFGVHTLETTALAVTAGKSQCLSRPVAKHCRIYIGGKRTSIAGPQESGTAHVALRTHRNHSLQHGFAQLGQRRDVKSIGGQQQARGKHIASHGGCEQQASGVGKRAQHPLCEDDGAPLFSPLCFPSLAFAGAGITGVTEPTRAVERTLSRVQEAANRSTSMKQLVSVVTSVHLIISCTTTGSMSSNTISWLWLSRIPLVSIAANTGERHDSTALCVSIATPREIV